MGQLPFAIVTVFFLFTACNNKSGQLATPSDDTVNSAHGQTEQVVPSPNEDPIILPEGQIEQLPAPEIDNVTEAAGSPDKLQQKANALQIERTDIKLNPAHGEPRHRCDIPVNAIMSTPPTGIKICK